MTPVAADTYDALTWSAHDTSTDLVADALRRLLHEAERTEDDYAAARTLNLVIAPGEAAAIKAGMATERHHYPARVVHLREHKVDRLDASVSVDLADVGDAHRQLLVEEVTLYSNRARLIHARSMLTPILARGIPTVAWLPGYDHDEIADALAQTAHVTVFDSDADPDPMRALAFARNTALAHPSRDLAWLRTTRWRSRISATFQTEERRSLLAFAPSCEVVGDVSKPAVLLLAAWVAAKLEINVSLRPGTGKELIDMVTVAGVEIQASVGTTCSPGLLSEALDTVYSAPLGYEDALQSLERVAVVA